MRPHLRPTPQSLNDPRPGDLFAYSDRRLYLDAADHGAPPAELDRLFAELADREDAWSAEQARIAALPRCPYCRARSTGEHGRWDCHTSRLSDGSLCRSLTCEMRTRLAGWPGWGGEMSVTPEQCACARNPCECQIDSADRRAFVAIARRFKRDSGRLMDKIHAYLPTATLALMDDGLVLLTGPPTDETYDLRQDRVRETVSVPLDAGGVAR